MVRKRASVDLHARLIAPTAIPQWCAGDALLFFSASVLLWQHTRALLENVISTLSFLSMVTHAPLSDEKDRGIGIVPWCNCRLPCYVEDLTALLTLLLLLLLLFFFFLFGLLLVVGKKKGFRSGINRFLLNARSSQNPSPSLSLTPQVSGLLALQPTLVNVLC